MGISLDVRARWLARDQKLDTRDVAQLIGAARIAGAEQAGKELERLLRDPALKDKFTEDGRQELQRFLGTTAATAESESTTPAAGNKGAARFSIMDVLTGARARDAVDATDVPRDLAAYSQELRDKLHGVLAYSCVSPGTAGREMARLSRMNDKDLETVADNIGAGLVDRLIDRLAPADKRKFAGTIAKLENAHFGAVLADAAKHGFAPRDASAAFQETMTQVKAGTNKLPADAKDFVYLTVPGLITEHYSGYMDENVKRLQDRGLTVFRSGIDTDQGTEKNAEFLSKEINALAARTGKKVVLLAHSKGGPDAALALRDPTTQKNVHLFVAMQAAYGGTPVADTVDNSILDEPTRFVLNRVWRAGDSKAVEDLSFRAQKERFEISRGNPPLEVPTLSLATTAREGTDSTSPLSLLSAFMEKVHYGGKARSDGMVPLTSQQIPGKNAFTVKVDGLSHEETIGQGHQPLYSPGDLTEALVTLGLRQAARAAPH